MPKKSLYLNTRREGPYSQYGRIDEDLEATHYNQEQLNEQLKRLPQRLPLCGSCLEFHDRSISCEDVAEMMWIDSRMLRYAIG